LLPRLERRNSGGVEGLQLLRVRDQDPVVPEDKDHPEEVTQGHEDVLEGGIAQRQRGGGGGIAIPTPDDRRSREGVRDAIEDVAEKLAWRDLDGDSLLQDLADRFRHLECSLV